MKMRDLAMSLKKVLIALCMIPGLAFCYDQPVRATDPNSVIPNTLSSLDFLIEVTGENYQKQKVLRNDIVEYQRIHDQYFQNTADQQLLFQLVMKADQILETIREINLTHVFDSEFVKELSLFSRFAKKSRVPNA